MPVYKGCALDHLIHQFSLTGIRRGCPRRAPSPKLPWEILMKVWAAMPLSTNPAAPGWGETSRAQYWRARSTRKFRFVPLAKELSRAV
jgi:hypothetical protein